jgi:hypothetical protein
MAGLGVQVKDGNIAHIGDYVHTPSDGLGSHTVSQIAKTLTFSRLPKAEQAAYAKVFPKTHQEKMYVELAPSEIVSGPYSSIAKGSSLPADFNAGKMTEIVLMRDWNRVFAPACTIIEIVLAFHAKHLMRGVVQRTRGYVYASDLLNIKGELKDAKCPASPFPSVADFFPGPPFSQRMYSVPRFLVDTVRAAMAGAKARTATGRQLGPRRMRCGRLEFDPENASHRCQTWQGFEFDKQGYGCKWPPAETSEGHNPRGSGA